MREDLADIAGIFYRNNRPSIMLFPTNGTMPERIAERIEEIVRSCSRSVVVLKLSVDGVGEEHDALRNTPGSFEKTLRTYAAVAGLIDRYPNFELGVNTVFCSENQDRMDGIMDFVRGLPSVKTHTISLISGAPADERYGNIDLGKYCAAAQKLEQNVKSRRNPAYRFRGAEIKAAQDVLQRRIIQRTLQEQRAVIPCYAAGSTWC